MAMERHIYEAAEGFERGESDALDEETTEQLLKQLQADAAAAAEAKAQSFALLQQTFPTAAQLIDHLKNVGYVLGDHLTSLTEAQLSLLSSGDVIRKVLGTAELALDRDGEPVGSVTTSKEAGLSLVQAALRRALVRKAAVESETELARHVVAVPTGLQQDAVVHSFLSYLAFVEHPCMTDWYSTGPEVFEVTEKVHQYRAQRALVVFQALRGGDMSERAAWVAMLTERGLTPHDFTAFMALRRSPSSSIEVATALGWSEEKRAGAKRKTKRSQAPVVKGHTAITAAAGDGEEPTMSGLSGNSLASLTAFLSGMYRCVNINSNWNWTDAYCTTGNGNALLSLVPCAHSNALQPPPAAVT
jgi:hypothetical protein